MCSVDRRCDDVVRYDEVNVCVRTFAIIAAAIISGAVVERIRFSAYAIFIVAWVLAVYVPLCHWIWGGGWIAEMGAKDCESAESDSIYHHARSCPLLLAFRFCRPRSEDFAGGTVVHISSGTSAFALASLLGERKHRSESFPSNLPFVILGGGILWLGWTGFNGGSAFAANGDCALAIATTYVAAAAAMITWVSVERILDGAPTSVGAMSGAVAGLATCLSMASLSFYKSPCRHSATHLFFLHDSPYRRVEVHQSLVLRLR